MKLSTDSGGYGARPAACKSENPTEISVCSPWRPSRDRVGKHTSVPFQLLPLPFFVTNPRAPLPLSIPTILPSYPLQTLYSTSSIAMAYIDTSRGQLLDIIERIKLHYEKVSFYAELA